MAADWHMFYYANPQPARFVPEVRTLAEEGHLSHDQAHFASVVFLSRVLAANPGKVRSWLTELDDVEGAARDGLALAAWLSDTAAGLTWSREQNKELYAGPAPDVLTLPVEEAAMLDALWSYYFATGDERAVLRVVSVFEWLPDHGAAERFRDSSQAQDRAAALRGALFSAASWSLESLMRQHRPLRAVCDRWLRGESFTPNVRVVVAMVLAKVEPERLRVEIDRDSGQARLLWLKQNPRSP